MINGFPVFRIMQSDEYIDGYVYIIECKDIEIRLIFSKEEMRLIGVIRRNSMDYYKSYVCDEFAEHVFAVATAEILSENLKTYKYPYSLWKIYGGIIN